MRVRFPLLTAGVQFGDALAGAGEVVGAPEEVCFGRFAVAAGAAGFLVIALDRLGQRGVGNEADVGLVDAHAKRDGRDHDHVFAGDEGGLVGGADGGV